MYVYCLPSYSTCTVGGTSRATFGIPASWISKYRDISKSVPKIILTMLQFRGILRIVSAVTIPKQSVAYKGIYCAADGPKQSTCAADGTFQANIVEMLILPVCFR